MPSDNRVFLFDGYQAKPGQSTALNGAQANPSVARPAPPKPKLPSSAPSAIQKPKG